MMRRCPITYQPLIDPEALYSPGGLQALSPRLKELKKFPYTSSEQRVQAIARAAKLSIQGVQLKLSARVNVTEHLFELVDRGGQYILKPPSDLWPELPANEDLSLRLADAIDIEVPFHGLMYDIEDQLIFFIKRFDRLPAGKKQAVEDFAQLNGFSRETKYKSSMETVATTIDRYATFPAIERLKLWERTLFCFLTGNEDMHLKNFSLISRKGRVELSPAYDLLNTTIVLGTAQEEMALPIRGRRTKLTRDDLITYFGIERLQLHNRLIEKTLEKIEKAVSLWHVLIDISFLSNEMKESYKILLNDRIARLYG